MKNKYFKILMLGTIGLLPLLNCTGNFEEIDSEYNGVYDEQLLADFALLTNPLRQIQSNLQNPQNWIYQLQTNLNADMYSGFFSTATRYNGGINNTTYFMMDGWNERIMLNQLEDVNQQYKNFKLNAPKYYPGIDFSQSLGT